MNDLDENGLENLDESTTGAALALSALFYLNDETHVANNFTAMMIFAAATTLFMAASTARRAGIISRDTANSVKNAALAGAAGSGIVLSKNPVMKCIPPVMFTNMKLRENNIISRNTEKALNATALLVAGTSVASSAATAPRLKY